MKRQLVVAGGIVFIVLLLTINVQAQLIDWDKRKKILERLNRLPPSTSADPAKPSVPPSWYQTPPKPVGTQENRYDVNRDKILQVPEVIVFLRDVLYLVEEKGGVAIDGNLLKEYDKNKDGLISREESKVLQELVK